jgi:glucan phosphorylase
VTPGAAGEVAAIGRTLRQHATYSLGKRWEDLTDRDRFIAVALSVRDRLVERRLATEERDRARPGKRVCYLSMEYLIGRSLAHHLESLRLREAYRAALGTLGASLEAIEDSEPDAALGNGGLGRLAACFLDSFATLGIAGWGYGILYEYGLFKQQIVSGEQRELPDNWLATRTPWLIARPDEACLVPVYGRIEHGVDRRGGYNPMWLDWRAFVGVPHDLFVPGHGGETVNVLRLFSARASHEFDMRIFNEGDYFRAVQQKIASETVSKVLYPSDAAARGRELRLVQEYFLVACAVRDIVRRFEAGGEPWSELPTRVAIQINDTHPSLAIVELLRILLDERDLAWDDAWRITEATFGFTNHTLAPEALERWPVPLLERVLPRHLQLVFEINRRFLDTVAVAFPGDTERRAGSARRTWWSAIRASGASSARLRRIGSHREPPAACDGSPRRCSPRMMRSCTWPICRPISMPRPRSRRRSAIARAGRAWRSAAWRAWASCRAIARSASTPAISGTWRWNADGYRAIRIGARHQPVARRRDRPGVTGVERRRSSGIANRVPRESPRWWGHGERACAAIRVEQEAECGRLRVSQDTPEAAGLRVVP